MFGLLMLKRKVSSRVYELKLLALWTLHPGFHVSLLERTWEHPIGCLAKEISVSDIVEEQLSYLVTKVVDSRWHGNPSSKFTNRFV